VCLTALFPREKKEWLRPWKADRKMKTENIGLLMNQVKGLKKPTLEEVLEMTEKNKRPDKIHSLAIREAKLGNITEAVVLIDLLWPSILEKDEHARFHCMLDQKAGHYSVNLHAGKEITDAPLHQYVDFLYLINFHLKETKSFDLMEKIGIEILHATNLVIDEGGAVGFFKSFLYQYVSEDTLAHAPTKVKADDIVRESFKVITPGILPDRFFLNRSVAYLRQIVLMSKDGSDAFIQLRIQAAMLDKIGRVLGIEVVRRSSAAEFLRLFGGFIKEQ
jgi:hypothetical protein